MNVWEYVNRILIIIGAFQLIPSEDILVCPGEQVDITCTTSDSTFLEWNVTIPYFSVSQTRAISSTNMVDFVSPLQVSSVMFTFEITSRTPLMSVLSIDSTTSDLNGTRIICTERTFTTDRVADIVLQVIDTNTTGLKQIE